MLKLSPLLWFADKRAQTKKMEVVNDCISAKSDLTLSKRLHYIEIEISTNHHKSFTAPNPDIKAKVFSSDRIAVGQ